MILEIYRNGEKVNTFTEGVENTLYKDLITYYIEKDPNIEKIIIKKGFWKQYESITFKKILNNYDGTKTIYLYKYIDVKS